MQERFTAVNLLESASERLRSHVEASIDTKRLLLKECEGDILAVAAVITRGFSEGRKLLLCGNGGSAADCQHIAAEFVGVLTQQFPRRGLPAIAMTTDSSILTASANDFGFEQIFSRQVQALGAPGDVVVGISTSGNSPNVLRALEYAAAHGMRTVGFTGASGGKLKAACEVCLRVPSDVTQFIQESHLMVGHIVCDLAEQSLHAAGLLAVHCRPDHVERE
jgi:D-sedoheptulose 7-phosphate isomerase